MAMPGDNLQIKIKLSYPLPINEGILIYKGTADNSIFTNYSYL